MVFIRKVISKDLTLHVRPVFLENSLKITEKWAVIKLPGKDENWKYMYLDLQKKIYNASYIRQGLDYLLINLLICFIFECFIMM